MIMRGRRGALCLAAAAVLIPSVFVMPVADAAAAPKIAGVSPNKGSTLGGTRVSVTGTNFSGVIAVRFGATAGTNVSLVSSTRVLVTTPAHASGVVNVRVVTK